MIIPLFSNQVDTKGLAFNTHYTKLIIRKEIEEHCQQALVLRWRDWDPFEYTRTYVSHLGKRKGYNIH